MSEDRGTAEFEAHLNALQTMPLQVARRLRAKLIVDRARVDTQLAFVNQVIEHHEALNGDDVFTPGRGRLDYPDPVLFPSSGPPSGMPHKTPSRRVWLLTIMARDPDRGWSQKELKARMVEVQAVTPDANGTKRVHSTVAAAKGTGEIRQVAPATYRITPKGLGVLGR